MRRLFSPPVHEAPPIQPSSHQAASLQGEFSSSSSFESSIRNSDSVAVHGQTHTSEKGLVGQLSHIRNAESLDGLCAPNEDAKGAFFLKRLRIEDAARGSIEHIEKKAAVRKDHSLRARIRYEFCGFQA